MTVFEDLGVWALRYAAAGVPVVPLYEPADTPCGCACGRLDCKRQGKHPRTPHGLGDASTAPAVVRSWWSRWPTANVGGLTGRVFDVCDVDGPAGAAAVAALVGEACHGGGLVRTGSGGWHLFVTPTGQGNRVKFMPEVDWRGVGGYVVLPPSRHMSGQAYRWVRPLDVATLPSAPAGLLAALNPPTAPAVRRPVAIRGDGYADAALTRECERLAAMPPDSGRNHQLNRSAFSLGQLVGSGRLTEADVTDALTGAALSCGLGERETARTLRSGLRAGIAHPRITRRAAS